MQPQYKGAVWTGRPAPSRVGRILAGDDRSSSDDFHPADVESISISVRGKTYARAVPLNAESAALVTRLSHEHPPRSVFVTVRKHDGTKLRFRGNGRRKATAHTRGIYGPHHELVGWPNEVPPYRKNRRKPAVEVPVV